VSEEFADGRRPSQPRLIIALEQSPRHAVHAWNLERAVRGEQDLDVRVVRVGPDGSARRWRPPGLRTWSFRASVATRAGLRRRLVQRSADAVYIHSQVASLLAVEVMRRVPTVISLDATPRNVDDVAVGDGHRRQGRGLEWVKWRLNRRALEAARALVAWSHWTSESLAGDYGVDPRKITVIRPGVDLARFRPGRPGHLDSGCVRILHVSHDFHREGGGELLEAMGELGPAVELDLVTDSRVTIPQGTRVRVHTGVDARSDQLVELFQGADIFALPTRSETYAQAIGQALACGLPVVATRVGAIPELVHPGDTGLLITPGSKEELAVALRTLVGDGELRRRMGASGLRLARAEHDACLNNRALFTLLRWIAGSSSAAESCRDVAELGGGVVRAAP
jgi:glycosyltransferase involved in cell wall biosynthesis